MISRAGDARRDEAARHDEPPAIPKSQSPISATEPPSQCHVFGFAGHVLDVESVGPSVFATRLQVLFYQCTGAMVCITTFHAFVA